MVGHVTMQKEGGTGPLVCADMANNGAKLCNSHL